MWSDVLVFWDATIFCKNFARWIQKIVATCDVTDVMWWAGFLGCYYVLKQLCKMITKYSSNTWCHWCDVLVFWDATIFCNNFARWLQKIVATCDVTDVMCWFFWDATIFCNNFARWWQKIVATFDDVMGWFSGMLLSFVTTLQDDYKDRSNMWCDGLVFCSVANKKLRDFAPTTLGVWVCIREYSNQAKFNRFLLNHFQLDRFPQMI